MIRNTCVYCSCIRARSDDLNVSLSLSLCGTQVAPALMNTQKGPYTSTALKSLSKSFGKTGKALEAQEVLKKKQACGLIF